MGGFFSQISLIMEGEGRNGRNVRKRDGRNVRRGGVGYGVMQRLDSNMITTYNNNMI